jgi:hypothetical protein
MLAISSAVEWIKTILWIHDMTKAGVLLVQWTNGS